MTRRVIKETIRWNHTGECRPAKSGCYLLRVFEWAEPVILGYFDGGVFYTEHGTDLGDLVSYWAALPTGPTEGGK